MNATLCRTTDVELELSTLVSLDEAYVTEVSSIELLPAPSDTPKTESLSELAIIATAPAYTDELRAAQMPTKQRMSSGLLSRSVQRTLIFCCFALSCMLLGFDVMGLLILHMH